jgi:hypothetical protein
MRDSVADLEKLLTTLHAEINHDKVFLSRLLDHKNATIGWFRDRQGTDIASLDILYQSMLDNHQESVAALTKLYDDMVVTLEKEVLLIETHLKTYEKGTPE